MPPINDCVGCAIKGGSGYCMIRTMGEDENCPCGNCAVKCMCSKICDNRKNYSGYVVIRNEPRRGD